MILLYCISFLLERERKAGGGSAGSGDHVVGGAGAEQRGPVLPGSLGPVPRAGRGSPGRVPSLAAARPGSSQRRAGRAPARGRQRRLRTRSGASPGVVQRDPWEFPSVLAHGRKSSDGRWGSLQRGRPRGSLRAASRLRAGGSGRRHRAPHAVRGRASPGDAPPLVSERRGL